MENLRSAYEESRDETMEYTAGFGQVPVAHVAEKIGAAAYDGAVLTAAGIIKLARGVGRAAVASTRQTARLGSKFVRDVSSEVKE